MGLSSSKFSFAITFKTLKHYNNITTTLGYYDRKVAAVCEPNKTFLCTTAALSEVL